MPESRPLGSILRFGAHDEPPASNERSPYPDRHSRLRRALQTTNDLSTDTARNERTGRTGNGSAGSTPPPRLYFTNARRTRRRTTESPEALEDERADREAAGSHGPFGVNSRSTGTRSNKRRKLNDDDAPAVRMPIRYGYYGQVEPGKLKMDIISNDGGEHIDSRHPDIYLGVRNILKLDKSVFCSQRRTASVIMRHADSTPFCLEKLHIVGPEHGFTAPVREGRVYVAMDINDLQKYLDPPYHARRAGVHEPPYRPPPVPMVSRSPERLTLSEALRDPGINAAASMPESDRAIDWDAELGDNEYYTGQGFSVGRRAPEPPCEMSESTNNANPDNPNNPHITLSSSSASLDHGLATTLTDDEAGPEDTSSQDILDYRLQRLRSMRRRYNIGSWDHDDRWSGLSNLHSNATEFERERERERAENPWALNRLEALMRPRGTGSSPPPPPRRSVSPMRTAPAELHSLEQGLSDPNVHVASFAIQKGKHKVAIRFDPAVSGRYILIKLWADGRRSNVDVQSVIPKGYGGQRFFPAIEPT